MVSNVLIEVERDNMVSIGVVGRRNGRTRLTVEQLLVRK